MITILLFGFDWLLKGLFSGLFRLNLLVTGHCRAFCEIVLVLPIQIWLILLDIAIILFQHCIGGIRVGQDARFYIDHLSFHDRQPKVVDA